MVFIPLTACYALVVGRILGELIRCPLVFCTFWLLAINCALASTTECCFMSLTMGNLLRRRRFQPQLYSDTIFLLFQWYPYPVGLYHACGYVHRSSFLSVRHCLCCRLPVVVNTKSSHSGTLFWRWCGADGSECQRSSQWILKSCQTHGGCPTMSYSN